jgi:hypothetical protein
LQNTSVQFGSIRAAIALSIEGNVPQLS